MIVKGSAMKEVKSPSQEGSSERRRVPRLGLTSEQFRLSANGKLFPVADISFEGMALRVLDRADLVLFPVGARFDGMLNLRREKHHVSAQVRHLGADLVGCRFEALSGPVEGAIRRFLDPAALGRELRPIPASDAVALWLHGPSGTDLMLWRHADGQYWKFLLIVLGSFIQWEDGRGGATGRITSAREESEVRGVIRLETMLLQTDEKTDPGKIALARKILTEAPLMGELRKWCLRQL